MENQKEHEIKMETDLEKKEMEKIDRIKRDMKLLVIDHDLSSLTDLENMLLNSSYNNVTICQSAKDAISMVQEDPKRFDMVLTSLRLPEIDRFEILKSMSAVNMDLSFITLTATDEDEDVTKKTIIHGADYLVEPGGVTHLWQYKYRRPERDIWRMNEKEKSANDIKNLKNNADSTNIGEGEDHNNHGKNMKKRKNDDTHTQIQKKRLVWTFELHEKFVQACDKIRSTEGASRVVPKRILEEMNEPGLTREHIGSHLQKYRQYVNEAARSRYRYGNSECSSQKEDPTINNHKQLPAQPFSYPHSEAKAEAEVEVEAQKTETEAGSSQSHYYYYNYSKTSTTTSNNHGFTPRTPTPTPTRTRIPYGAYIHGGEFNPITMQTPPSEMNMNMNMNILCNNHHNAATPSQVPVMNMSTIFPTPPNVNINPLSCLPDQGSGYMQPPMVQSHPVRTQQPPSISGQQFHDISPSTSNNAGSYGTRRCPMVRGNNALARVKFTSREPFGGISTSTRNAGSNHMNSPMEEDHFPMIQEEQQYGNIFPSTTTLGHNYRKSARAPRCEMSIQEGQQFGELSQIANPDNTFEQTKLPDLVGNDEQFEPTEHI